MIYLLDTNVLSEVMKKHPNAGVLRRLAEISPREIATSVVCLSELRYGAARVAKGGRLWQHIANEVLRRVTVLPLGAAEALRAGDLMAELEKRGEPIGIEEVWIAATAMEHALTLVTRNLRHFTRITGLRSESWWE